MKNEFYCIIDAKDSLSGMEEEINMRVSGATEFLLKSKDIGNFSDFHRVYDVEDLIALKEEQKGKKKTSSAIEKSSF